MSYINTITTDVHNPVVPANPPVHVEPVYTEEEIAKSQEAEAIYPNGLMF